MSADRCDESDMRQRYCSRCVYNRSNTVAIPGLNGARVSLAVVTDRVSGLDQQCSTVMSGPMGALLQRILAAPQVEIDPGDVYLTSAVACRTPDCRPPRRQHIDACAERLRGELLAAAPSIIVALGEQAALSLCADGAVPSHGWLTDVHPDLVCPVYVTEHLSGALWGDDGEIRRVKRIMYEDWKTIGAAVREAVSAV